MKFDSFVFIILLNGDLEIAETYIIFKKIYSFYFPPVLCHIVGNLNDILPMNEKVEPCLLSTPMGVDYVVIGLDMVVQP